MPRAGSTFPSQRKPPPLSPVGTPLPDIPCTTSTAMGWMIHNCLGTDRPVVPGTSGIMSKGMVSAFLFDRWLERLVTRKDVDLQSSTPPLPSQEMRAPNKTTHSDPCPNYYLHFYARACAQCSRARVWRQKRGIEREIPRTLIDGWGLTSSPPLRLRQVLFLIPIDSFGKSTTSSSYLP